MKFVRHSNWPSRKDRYGNSQQRQTVRQGQQEMLDTLIHEAMHAARPEIDEEAVATASRDIARLLWNLGYRRNP